MSRPVGRIWASAFLAVVVQGCSGEGDEYPREAFSGTITLDGKPLPNGYVIFEPKSGGQTQSGGMIEAGRFVVPREQGAVPGTYSVGIFSGAEAAPDPALVGTPEGEAAARKIRGEMVPRRYNIDSILTAEIKTGDPNDFKFELTTRAK